MAGTFKTGGGGLTDDVRMTSKNSLTSINVDVAAATAHLNDVVVEVSKADVLRDPLPPGDVVVANIELPVVEQLLERLDARYAVTSGYFASERPTASGWTPVDRVELEGWAADVLAKRH